MQIIFVLFGVFVASLPMITTRYTSYAEYSLPRDCELNERRPNLLDPHSFYWCLYDGPVLFKCVDGMYFNVSLGRCTEEERIPDEDNKAPLDSDVVEEEPRCPQPKFAPKNVNCPPVDPMDRSIYFPDPHSCGCFYQCDNGVAKRIPCRKDLHFNATTSLCDWPEEAGCELPTGYSSFDEAEYIKLI